MVSTVGNYSVLFYGSPSGYQTNRAQIALYGSDTRRPAAYIRFNDPGMYFEPDSESGGVIYMYLPSAMFEGVVDILRNEKPVYMRFAQSRAFLSTSKEPVGEDE